MSRRARILAPVVLLVAVALIATTGACLVHPDDGVSDVCASLLAVTLGLTLVLVPGGTREVVSARPDRYHTASITPPTPPPRI